MRTDREADGRTDRQICEDIDLNGCSARIPARLKSKRMDSQKDDNGCAF